MNCCRSPSALVQPASPRMAQAESPARTVQVRARMFCRICVTIPLSASAPSPRRGMGEFLLALLCRRHLVRIEIAVGLGGERQGEIVVAAGLAVALCRL